MSIKLLIGLFVLGGIGQAVQRNEDSSDFVEVCTTAIGSLSISPRFSHIATVNEGKAPTVFVNEQTEFNFECKIKESDPDMIPQIKFKPHINESNESRLTYSYADPSQTQRSLKSSWLTRMNPVNYENVTVQCLRVSKEDKEEGLEEGKDDDEICKVKVIVIGRLSSNCSMNGALSCRAKDLWEQIKVLKNSKIFIPRNNSKTLEPVVRYSIFTHENQSWIFCNETDKAGSRAKAGTHLEIDTESIVCPVPRKSFKGPVLIRIEESEKTGLSVALPVYNGGGNTSYTYFSVFVNQTVYDDLEVDQKSQIIDFNEAAVIAPICVAVVVVVCIVGVAIFCFKRRCKRVPKENKTSKFYVDNVMCEDAKCFDNMSTRTQSTSVNGYSKTSHASSVEIPMLNFEKDNFFIFDESDDYSAYMPYTDGDDEEAVTLRRNIVARQLSGDPSKINPALSLNQQAQALAYNPKLEIERAKFKIGQLLGSGNFGSVYVGEAEGLYYPGSVTKVAVKTVNDALDRSQLTALLCEVKILANLEHHLNLVNLMGSCTSELHNGELWLLLEFCGHGDLKNFLIRHRGQFKNNLSGLCATGFDSRLFLKWAHSIAKGMEYLTSKRIMHGDLAARNILISATEGYIAKVSDFGLSKTFYDNVRYKKRFRHYVPWKWMAIEYLKDACFTMKSDVWSYGVVLWEIFSLGQEPYAGKSIEEVITQIKAGYRLKFPEDVADVAWAEDVYNDVMRKCWDADPSTRCSFGEIVNSLEKLMAIDELNEYHESSEKCRSMKELMLDDAARSKRSTLLSPNSAPGDFAVDPTLSFDNPGNVNGNAYVTVQQATTPFQPDHFIPNGGYISVNEAKQQMAPANGSYITISQAKSNAAAIVT